MSSTSATTESLHLELFGGPRLYRGDEEILLSPYQSALLGMVFGREEVSLLRIDAVSHLWPDEDPAKARHRLNQLLHNLKKRVGEPGAFDVQWKEIFRATSGISTDFEEYLRALEAGSFQTCSLLLQKGFFSMSVGVAPRHHADWIASREAELRLELRNRAERHWLNSFVEEDWGGAREAAETLFNLTPDDEKRLQRLMEARAKTGDTAGAEEAFSDFSHRRTEDSWTPTKETNALLDTIRSGTPIPSSSELTEIRQGPPEPPLLGRTEQRSTLRKTLVEVPEGEIRGIFISGEAGIGKTRLIREALHGLLLDGQKVLSSESAELEQLIPLNPLIEIFKGPDVGVAVRRLDEPWRTVLFGVMPSHYLGEGPIPEAPHIQPGSVPRRLFEAFYQLLFSLVQTRPLILVLEDLQWADETTLLVLGFLFRRWDHGGLQIVLSARAEEVRRNSALRPFLETLRSHNDSHEVNLGDLEPSASEALIQHMATEPMEVEHISQLRSLAGGNPFFLIELTLEFLADRLGPVATHQEMVSIPLSIRQVLERRLSQLSSEAELVLGSLAVFSRPIDLNGLARIAHLSETKCLSGLDQLHRFRLVTNRGTDELISHELVRQTVYQGLTTSRRAWLHNRVGRHLLRTRKTTPPDELAVHFDHAGAAAEARTYATEAADRAEASGATPEALRFLRIAREHSDTPEEVAGLIKRMGHLNYKHQNLDEAAPLLELAAHRFRRQGDHPRALEAEIERIDCLVRRGKHLGQDCLEELELLKREAKSRGLWELFHAALDVEAHELDRKGDLEGVRAVLAQAQENFDEGGLKAQCRGRAMVALNIYFGSPIKGLWAAREAVAIAKQTSDAELLLYALNRLIVVLHYQGRLHTPEGVEALSEAESRFGSCGDLILKFHVKLNRAVWHLEFGELPYAKTAFSAAEDLIRGIQARDAQAKLQLNLGELGVVSHDFHGAKVAYESAMSLITPSSPHYFHSLATAGMGLCSLQNGDLGEARRMESELPAFPDFWSYDPSIVTMFKTKMLIKRQDTHRALALLDQIRESVKGRLVPAWLRLTVEESRILRRIQPDRALSLASDGLGVAEDLGLTTRMRQLHRLRESLT